MEAERRQSRDVRDGPRVEVVEAAEDPVEAEDRQSASLGPRSLNGGTRV
jgi:hypothetical protein